MKKKKKLKYWNCVKINIESIFSEKDNIVGLWQYHVEAPIFILSPKLINIEPDHYLDA